MAIPRTATRVAIGRSDPIPFQPPVRRFVHRNQLSARRAAGCRKFCSIEAIRPALDYLRGLSVAPPPATSFAVEPVDLMLERYRRHLLVERVPANFTVHLYVLEARLFLERRLSADGQALNFGDLCSADVASYVMERCSLRGHGAAKHAVKVLRSLLRFLHVEGIIERSLVAAIPSVSNRQLLGLPKGLDLGCRNVVRRKLPIFQGRPKSLHPASDRMLFGPQDVRCAAPPPQA